MVASQFRGVNIFPREGDENFSPATDEDEAILRNTLEDIRKSLGGDMDDDYFTQLKLLGRKILRRLKCE